MTGKIIIRKAEPEEYSWINDQYDQIGFVHSEVNKDLVLIAEINGERAGIGRLVQVSYEDAELGGMYVFEKFRGSGVSHQLIRELLTFGKDYKNIYCLPFGHLQSLYVSHGFIPVVDQSMVPHEVVKKHNWCNESYKGKITLLMELNKHIDS